VTGNGEPVAVTVKAMLTVRLAPVLLVPVISIVCGPTLAVAGTTNEPVTTPELSAVSVPSVTGSEWKTTVTTPRHPPEVSVKRVPTVPVTGDTVPAMVVVVVVPATAVVVVVAPVAAVVVVVPPVVVVVGAAVVVVVGGAVVLVVVVAGIVVLVVVVAGIVVLVVVVDDGIVVLVVVVDDGIVVLVVVDDDGIVVLVVVDDGTVVLVVVVDDVVDVDVEEVDVDVDVDVEEVDVVVVVGGLLPAAQNSPLGSLALAAKVIVVFQKTSSALVFDFQQAIPMLYVPGASVNFWPPEPSIENLSKLNVAV
jgi:hypothetical protein